MSVNIQGGPAQPVQSSSQAPSGGPAIPVAVLTDVEANARGVIAGPVQAVVEVTDGRIRLGGDAIPVVVGSGNGFTIAGSPIPVYVVSGSLNPSTPAPVNTVLPAVSGTLNLGQTLTTTDGTWLNSPTSYTYQWKRGGVNIGGATNNTYVTVLADVGQTITVTVTATNAGGSTPATSVGAHIFSPADVAGLQLWLKADAIVGLNDGDTVATWADSSGNGNDATQATVAKQPHYKTGIINSLPVVRFDGSDDFLSVAFDPGSTGLTVAAVVRTTTGITAYQGVLASGGAGGTVGIRWLFSAGDDGTYGMGWAGVASEVALGSGAGNVADTNYIFDWRTNKVAWSVRRNGTVISTPADTSFPVGTFNGKIGSETGAEYFLHADLPELIVYSAAISDANRTSLLTYLNAKYAVF